MGLFPFLTLPETVNKHFPVNSFVLIQELMEPQQTAMGLIQILTCSFPEPVNCTKGLLGNSGHFLGSNVHFKQCGKFVIFIKFAILATSQI
jgi:hypothetical protein